MCELSAVSATYNASRQEPQNNRGWKRYNVANGLGEIEQQEQVAYDAAEQRNCIQCNRPRIY